MSDNPEPTTGQVDEVAVEIRQRLDAISEQVSEATSDEKIRAIVTEALKAEEPEDREEVGRKFRADTGDAAAGPKFRGLTETEIELCAAIQEAKATPGGGGYPGPSEELRNAVAAVRKRAMDTAESGFGSQLIGNQYANNLWEAARREARIWPLINTFSMTAPTAYLPVEVDFPEALFVSESTASNSSNYSTSKTGSQRVQVDAKKFVIHQMWSGEMEEDSLVPFMPFLSRQAAKSISFYQDSLILNGDTTNSGTGNINLDDANPADTKHYLAWDGLRHAAIVDNTGNAVDASGAITYEDFYTNLRDKMWDSTRYHDWGNPNNPNDLIFVMDRSTASKASLLSEVITVDKMGGTATVLTGEIGRVGRSPIVISSAMSLTEADGKVSTTAGNNTKGQVCCFNRNGFAIGIRRGLKVETERLPATDQTRIVYSARWGFGRFTPTGAASGIEAAAVLYDITV